MDRLIDGLRNGNPLTIGIVVIALVGTAAIFIVTEIIQRRRKRDKDKSNTGQ